MVHVLEDCNYFFLREWVFGRGMHRIFLSRSYNSLFLRCVQRIVRKEAVDEGSGGFSRRCGVGSVFKFEGCRKLSDRFCFHNSIGNRPHILFLLTGAEFLKIFRECL